MRCYIDGNVRTSDMFWKEVQVLLTSTQRQKLLDGWTVSVGGREYCVITDEMAEEMEKQKSKEHNSSKKKK